MEKISEACSEMDFIINNLDEELANKIPDKIKVFFRENKAKNYKINLTVDKPLYEQNLLEETEIFIQIIFKLFMSSQEEKNKYIAESRKLYVTRMSEEWLKKQKNN